MIQQSVWERKDNYKFLGNFARIPSSPLPELAALRADVQSLEEAAWTELVLTTQLSEHLNAVILEQHGDCHPLWQSLKCETRLAPVFDALRTHYRGGSQVLVTLTRLKKHTHIPLHRDGPEFQPPFQDEPHHCYRRCHIPLLTNSLVQFIVGGERRHLGYGEVWEINNWREHRVQNDGTSHRVHLIIDWNAP